MRNAFVTEVKSYTVETPDGELLVIRDNREVDNVGTGSRLDRLWKIKSRECDRIPRGLIKMNGSFASEAPKVRTSQRLIEVAPPVKHKTMLCRTSKSVLRNSKKRC